VNHSFKTIFFQIFISDYKAVTTFLLILWLLQVFWRKQSFTTLRHLWGWWRREYETMRTERLRYVGK